MGSDTPTPDGSVAAIGGMCEPGYYCPQGASSMLDNFCQVGTYNDKYGADSDAYCITCPDGLICDAEALPEPLDDCDAGYYCTGETN